MALSGDAVRRIREAFNEATGTPLEEDAFAEGFGISANSEHPIRITAFNVDEGWARDVSEDMTHAAIHGAPDRKTWLTKKPAN